MSHSRYCSESPTIAPQSGRKSFGKTMPKRGHPHLYPATNESEAQRRRGKRQRRDNPLMSIVEQRSEWRSWPCQYENRCQIDQEPRFATTSAQFGLFSKPGRSPKTRRLQPLNSKTSQDRQSGYLTDLVHLRSSAFWELRQSIADNGESLVRRMREYERSRSRNHAHQKAKDAEKRGRKRVSQRTKKTFANDSDASQDEDILIFSGESPNQFPRTLCPSKRKNSLDTMDVDHKIWPSTSTQHTRHTHTTAITPSDEEDLLSLDDDISSSDKAMTDSLPSLSNSSCGSAHSSVISLSLPSSTLTTTEDGEPFSYSSTASEKTLAALNLALANGAGSINDYYSVWSQEEVLEAERYDHGDLWH